MITNNLFFQILDHLNGLCSHIFHHIFLHTLILHNYILLIYIVVHLKSTLFDDPHTPLMFVFQPFIPTRRLNDAYNPDIGSKRMW